MLSNCSAGELSRVPWTARRSNQLNPKGNQLWIFIGSTDAETPILWPPDAKSQLIGKDPDAGKDWEQEEKGRQRMRWLDDIIYSMDMSLGKLWEIVKGREDWHVAVHGVTKSWTWQSNWTKTIPWVHRAWTFKAEVRLRSYFPYLKNLDENQILYHNIVWTNIWVGNYRNAKYKFDYFNLSPSSYNQVDLWWINRKNKYLI